MRFHDFVYGSNVSLNKSRSQATRVNDQCFYDGIVFSNKPIKNQLVTVEVESFSTKWKGHLNVGLTSRDPLTFVKERPLPKYSYPIGLCLEEGVWMRPLPGSWSQSRISFLLTSSANGTNQLELVHSNETRYPFIVDLPSEQTFLWLIFDLYGRTTRLTISDSSEMTYKIPMSVSLQGPNIVRAYEKACTKSCIKYNRTRIFCIGPAGSGKSCLNRLLLGISDRATPSDSILDTQETCLTDMNGSWNDQLNELNFPDELSQFKIMSYNIVKESKANKSSKDENDENATLNAGEILKNALRLSNRKNDHFDDINGLDNQETVKILPVKFREMIDTMLSKPNLTSLPDLETGSIDEKEIQPTIYSKYSFWDFKGDTLYFLVNQILLSSQAVYLMVIDLSRNLDEPICSRESQFQAEGIQSDFSTLNLFHHWLSLIYSHVSTHGFSEAFRGNTEAEDEDDEDGDGVSNPKVILIGTHCGSCCFPGCDGNNKPAEPADDQPPCESCSLNTCHEKFARLEESLKGKVYKGIVNTKFLSIDCHSANESQINEIKSMIDETVIQQKLIDHDIPYSWIQFESIIDKLNKKGIYFADINQIYELTKVHISEVRSLDSLQAILQFYHLSGRIYVFKSSYGGPNEMLIVLDPIWFINCFYQLCQIAECTCSNDPARMVGVLTDETINSAWKDCIEHKTVLLGCLEKLDIICELSSGIDLEEPVEVASLRIHPKVYLFPWIAQVTRDTAYDNQPSDSTSPDNQFKFSLDFKDILPIGLFSRLVVRLCRWSWRQRWGRRPEIWHAYARIAVDFDHDLILKVNLARRRFFLVITKIYDTIGTDTDPSIASPAPNVCVKVRHLIETELETLQNCYYRRLVYSLEVPCPCDLICKLHFTKCCTEESCLHFIPLNKCLNKKVVECDYRQIRTNFVQKYFPVIPYYSSVDHYSGNNIGINEDSALALYDHINTYDNIFRIEPLWMRDAAKMLITGNPGRDWLALARRLGYNDKDVSRLVDDASPSLALIHDWFESNGRTRYCIDVLMSCLQMISREDVRQVIEMDLQPVGSAPPVFLSYQWDSQKMVLDLRRRLELAGFPCWMDIGLMGGGDSLYGKIYEGISGARVIIACLTPRYASSRICAREVTLADVLRKPILPVMIEPTPWPPPGPMAVVMSSLVFIDLWGVEGHGGIGKSGDSESRFRDILNTISRYIAGNPESPLQPYNPGLSHLFYPRPSDPRLSFAAITPDLRSTSPPPVPDQPSTSAEAEEIVDYYAADRSGDIISGDSLSVLSRRETSNRISNCSVCSLI